MNNAAATDMLDRNLAALARTHRDLAERIRAADATPRLQWTDAKVQPDAGGVRSASIEHDGRPLQLASRVDPLTEAKRLVDNVDFEKSACVVVVGFGLGYHARLATQGVGRRGFCLVFEPDLALMREVFCHVDHTNWLGNDRTIMVDATADRATLIRYFEAFNAVVTQGTHLLVHPPSRKLQSQAHAEFTETVTEALAYCRTTVATTLVNASRTVSNLLNNLRHYTAGPTINALYQAAKGCPAVCVAAGPSLAKNVDLLQNETLRQNVVVIAAQTALKPLLSRGIRPNFVTALDYAEVSRRFYEDLPPLPDVTLVADAKANPVILDSFPGPVRITQSSLNDTLLGDLARPMRRIPNGATVAHLSFYLAQFLGCDPIIFIGQDLGFSDGLYYMPGTAVHDLWRCELNRFNTLEMMEWRRIVRHRAHLVKREDQFGQPCFTDEQMLTYLKQFERDFATAPQTIIDATEGGLAKQHTTAMPLADALDQHATQPIPSIPTPDAALDVDRLNQLTQRLNLRLREVAELKDCTRDATKILRQMQRHREDRARMAKLFHRMQRVQKRVHGPLTCAFHLVSQVNAIGGFRRARADRLLEMQAQDAMDRQSRQIERDLTNLDWILQGCDEVRTLLETARQRLDETPASQPVQTISEAAHV